MPEVTYTADGGHYRVAGEGFDPDETRDVDAELADYLADHEDFEVGVSADSDDVDESENDADAEAEADGFDVDEFLNDNVPPIEDAIAAGEVDDHLSALDDASERVGVQDAIGERRAELEG